MVATAAEDVRSVAAIERLRAEWRRVKKQPAAVKVAWLRSGRGAILFGEEDARRRVSQLEEAARRRETRVRAVVCSGTWADTFAATGMLPPRLTFGKRDAVVPLGPFRKYAVRLVLSRAEVSNGFDVPGSPRAATASVGSRRFTPPQCVDLEDSIDSLTPDEALKAWMTWPQSPSAEAIHKIHMRGATPIDGNW